MEPDRRDDCKLNIESFAAGKDSNHEFITLHLQSVQLLNVFSKRYVSLLEDEADVCCINVFSF